MVPQVPNRAVGAGIALILGAWALLVADAIKQRPVIVGFGVLTLLYGVGVS